MISVVIPLYNKAHTIVGTLNSVFSQTYQNFEVIIVDDGSTDNGVEVINKHFEDPRIVIVQQLNSGVSVARNRGVEKAKSNWIAFLDGDDKWHPDYLSIMSEQILKNPDSGMFSSGGLIQDSQGFHYRLCNKYLNYIGKIDFFQNPFLFAHTSGTIVNKSVFKQLGGFPVGMKCLEDFTLFVQIALVSDFVYIGMPLSKYMGGIEGQITSIDKNKRSQWIVYVVLFFNLFYKKWLETGCRCSTVRIFLLYDLRNRFKRYLNSYNWKSLDYLYSSIDPGIKSMLFGCERFFYKKHLSVFGRIWINITKLLWRTNGFPIIGEKVNINRIDKKYRKW